MIFTLGFAYLLFKHQQDKAVRSYADAFYKVCTDGVSLLTKHAASKSVKLTTKLLGVICGENLTKYKVKTVRSNVLALIKHTFDNKESDQIKGSFIKFSNDEKTKKI